MTLPIFDRWQTTFVFNALANAASNITIKTSLDKHMSHADALKAAAQSAAASLTTNLTDAVSKVIADNNASATPSLGAKDWQLVWGPQVLCLKPQPLSVHWAPFYTAKFVATNALYVVHSASLGRYVVAIAATNASSLYDWVDEDFDTAHVVAWDQAMQQWQGQSKTVAPSSAIPCISQATCTGITNLLAITDSKTGTNLPGFLKGLTPAAGTTLTFTGHSLAGALSPTLAMACFDPTAGLLKGSAWQVGNAMIYPTAGATPGNQSFASLVNGAGWAGANDKGSQPWQIWNADLYNNVDVVPHAWGAAMMDLIPTYYGAFYGKIDEAVIGQLIQQARATAAQGEAQAGAYTPINNQALNPTGTTAAQTEFVDRYTLHRMGGQSQEYLTPAEAAAISPTPTDKTEISWKKQMLYQHTIAYSRLILQLPPAPIQ